MNHEIKLPKDIAEGLVEIEEEMNRGPGGTIGYRLLKYIATEYPDIAKDNPFVFEDLD